MNTTLQFTAIGKMPERVIRVFESMNDKTLWEMVIRKPGRTIKQNSFIHAMFREAAVEMNKSSLVLNYAGFEAEWTENTVKDLFKQAFLAGKGTSDTDIHELSKAVDAFLNSCARKGVEIEAKEARKFVSETTKLFSKFDEQN